MAITKDDIKEPKYFKYTFCSECNTRTSQPFLIKGKHNNTNFLNMVLCKKCYDYIFTNIEIRKEITK